MRFSAIGHFIYKSPFPLNAWMKEARPLQLHRRRYRCPDHPCPSQRSIQEESSIDVDRRHDGV